MRVEQDGAETCEVASNGGFVLVRVPVRVTGEVRGAAAVFRYQIGGFVGRETSWPRPAAHGTTLTFRIPVELFRERQRLTLEVLRTDTPAGRETLWATRYDVSWVGGIPAVIPVPE